MGCNSGCGSYSLISELDIVLSKTVACQIESEALQIKISSVFQKLADGL